MEANSYLACALRGKPCMRTTQQEVELQQDGTLVVLSGQPRQPLCDGCPHAEDADRPAIQHLTIVHNPHGTPGAYNPTTEGEQHDG